MIKIENNFLTESERSTLLKKHRVERDGRKKDRIKCIVLLNDGWSYAKIAEALLVDDQTLRNYWKSYKEKSFESFLSFNYSGRASLLSSSEYEELKKHLSENTYVISKQIQNYIKETYKKSYSKQGVISLLKKMGFVYKKAKLVPGNPNVEEQEKFVKEYEELKDNLKSDEEIIFIDGVHPSHNVRATSGWILKGKNKHILSNTGRFRLNINGAYNPLTQDVIYRNEETINAKSTGMLILDILDKYPNAKKINIILDNAGYNRSKLMNLFANFSRINLIYLPPYCPNLNLIERLWKFLHKKVTLCRYYKKFAEFKEATLTFLDNIHNYKNELSTLMTENFGIIRPKSSNFILD